jgi:hypothetical protein
MCVVVSVCLLWEGDGRGFVVEERRKKEPVIRKDIENDVCSINRMGQDG